VSIAEAAAAHVIRQQGSSSQLATSQACSSGTPPHDCPSGTHSATLDPGTTATPDVYLDLSELNSDRLAPASPTPDNSQAADITSASAMGEVSVRSSADTQASVAPPCYRDKQSLSKSSFTSEATLANALSRIMPEDASRDSCTSSGVCKPEDDSTSGNNPATKCTAQEARPSLMPFGKIICEARSSSPAATRDPGLPEAIGPANPTLTRSMQEGSLPKAGQSCTLQERPRDAECSSSSLASTVSLILSDTQLTAAESSPLGAVVPSQFCVIPTSPSSMSTTNPHAHPLPEAADFPSSVISSSLGAATSTYTSTSMASSSQGTAPASSHLTSSLVSSGSPYWTPSDPSAWSVQPTYHTERRSQASSISFHPELDADPLPVGQCGHPENAVATEPTCPPHESTLQAAYIRYRRDDDSFFSDENFHYVRRWVEHDAATAGRHPLTLRQQAEVWSAFCHCLSLKLLSAKLNS
jgi:hypothetical protein